MEQNRSVFHKTKMLFCLLIRSANLSYGFPRKSGHAHYNMFFFQQNPPLAFGRTLFWKWLKRSCLQCTCVQTILNFFEGSFKDVGIINMFLAWLRSNKQQVKYQPFSDVLSFVCRSNKRVISKFRHAGEEVLKYFFISKFLHGWSLSSFGESLDFC